MAYLGGQTLSRSRLDHNLPRVPFTIFLISISACAQPLPYEDAVRVAEFYRLTAQIQEKIWQDWSKVPASLLLITLDREFLTHFPMPPKDFIKAQESEEGFYWRPRKFDTHFLA